MKRRILTGLCVPLLLVLAAACGRDPSTETDAQLGLNAQQAAGRRIYNLRCAGCHKAYSSRGSQGPGLKHMFAKRYLPSGLPANDRFVERTIINGRGMMPAAGYTLSDEELRDLLAYLHTL